MSKNKKKLGYSQYESLLSDAHRKIHELQTYFIAYIEYRGDNIQFNQWLNKRIQEVKDQSKKEKVHEKV